MIKYGIFQPPEPAQLDSVGDVVITTPSNGQVLQFDNGVWKNVDLPPQGWITEQW